MEPSANNVLRRLCRLRFVTCTPCAASTDIRRRAIDIVDGQAIARFLDYMPSTSPRVLPDFMRIKLLER